MIRAVIFDCFGVIITDALQVVRGELQQFNPEGAREIDELVRAANKGLLATGESNERIAAILGVSVNAYRERIAAGELKDQALLDYILTLRNTYKTALLSNIPGPSLRRRFSEEELTKYFDVAVATGDIGWAKPEPEAYQYVADALGLRCDECLFTDDRELFVEAARAVGMQGIVYTDFTQFKQAASEILNC